MAACLLGAADFDLINESEDLDGDRGQQGDHGDDAEGIRHDVAAYGITGADGKRHEKSRGHGAGGDAAGVKGDGGENVRDKERQQQRGGVADPYEPENGDPRQRAHHGEPDGERYAGGNGNRQHFFGDRAGGCLLYLLFQHLNGRLRRDEEVADDHAERDEDQTIGGIADGCADVASDRKKSDVDT